MEDLLRGPHLSGSIAYMGSSPMISTRLERKVCRNGIEKTGLTIEG